MPEDPGDQTIFCGLQTMVCHPGIASFAAVFRLGSSLPTNGCEGDYPCTAHFVINGRSRGHFGDKVPPSEAVLLQYSPPNVARRTAIALMMG